MLNPLKIGDNSYDVNIVQGPLAGISCAPFRRITHEYGKPAFCYTEMISCKTLIYQPKAHTRLTHIDKHEGQVCFQLSSSNPNELSEAVKIVTDLGANLIDLNCGCPVNKIRSRGEGSALLQKPAELFQLIVDMKQNTHLPISIKIRVESQSNDKFNHDIAKVIHDAGADFVTVHGRHWHEHYETPCHYDQIKFFVNELKIPVIGNGDVACLQSLQKMLATGCRGVMIGRAGVGQPWLIQKLIAERQGKSFIVPTLVKIKTILLQHTRDLIELLGNEQRAIFQTRKFAKYYGRDFIDKNAFEAEMNQCTSYEKLNAIVDRYFI